MCDVYSAKNEETKKCILLAVINAKSILNMIGHDLNDGKQQHIR